MKKKIHFFFSYTVLPIVLPAVVKSFGIQFLGKPKKKKERKK